MLAPKSASSVIETDLLPQQKLEELIETLRGLLAHHHELLTNEIKIQSEINEKLYDLIQRYVIIKKSSADMLDIPEDVFVKVQRACLNEIQNHIRAVERSNAKLRLNYRNLDRHLQALRTHLRETDYYKFNPSIQDNWAEVAIYRVNEIFHDVCSQFAHEQATLRLGATLIRNENNFASIIYGKLLKLSEDFEEFIQFAICICGKNKYKT